MACRRPNRPKPASPAVIATGQEQDDVLLAACPWKPIPRMPDDYSTPEEEERHRTYLARRAELMRAFLAALEKVNAGSRSARS